MNAAPGGTKPRLVLIVKYYLPTQRISGVISLVRLLVAGLARRFDVHVVAWRAEPEGPEYVEIEGCAIHRVGAPFPLRAGVKANALRPDAVLVVSGVNDMHLAVPYFGLLNGALRTGAPRCFYQATNTSRPPSALLASVLRGYRAVLCGSPQILEHFAPRFGERAILAVPGVDIEALQSVPTAVRQPRLRLGFVNHLNATKGADIALRAFAALAGQRQDVELIVAGTGVLGNALRQQYADTDRVTFFGFLPDEERLRLMRSCDVMVLPFRTGVSVLGISQTVLECMALGVVVVAADTPATSPAIRSGEEGLLFHSEVELVDLLRSLCDDRQQLAHLAQAAEQRVRRDFDVNHTVAIVARALGQT